MVLSNSRRLVHLFMDLFDGEFDVVLDAVQDVLEVRFLVHIELSRRNKRI